MLTVASAEQSIDCIEGFTHPSADTAGEQLGSSGLEKFGKSKKIL